MNIKEIKELMDLLKNSDVNELEIEREGVKIKLKKGVASPVITQATLISPQPVPVQQHTSAPHQLDAAKEARPAAAEVKKEEKGITINSPMVGTFYRAPSPDAPAYAKEGDVITEGKTVCIIEAMKLMNEIKAEIKGKIIKVLVENGQPVEFGQPLFLVE